MQRSRRELYRSEDTFETRPRRMDKMSTSNAYPRLVLMDANGTFRCDQTTVNSILRKSTVKLSSAERKVLEGFAFSWIDDGVSVLEMIAIRGYAFR